MTTVNPPRALPVDAPRSAPPAEHAPRGFDRLFRFEPVRALTDAARAGDVVRLGTRPAAMLVNHPLDVRHVLARNAANYVKAGFENEFRGLFGESLITAEGESHRRDRKRFAAHFQQRSLDWTLAAVHEATARLLDEWREPVTINLAARMMRLTVEIAGRTMLGITDPQVSGALQDAIRGMHRAIIRRRRGAVRWPWWLPVQVNRHYRRSTRAFNDLLARVIAERRGSLRDDDVDLLSVMLRWQAESPGSFSDVWVRDQAAQLFFAAYEPLGNTLSWTLCLLAQHADEQAPPDWPLGDILNESMRLYPPTWLLARRALADDRLPGGVHIPRGMRLLISPYLLHRRADLYPDPERFDARRFAAAASEPYTFIPFGGGPRICLGEHMARMAAEAILAMILPRHSFTLPNGRPEVESLNHFTAQPRDGVMMMRIEPRVL